MNWTKHLATLCSIVALIFLVRYLEVRRHNVVRKPSARFVPNEEVRKLEMAAFVPIGASGFWSALETNFAALARTNATNWQHTDALLPEIRRFIECYSAGTFDSYVEFKTAGIPYEFSFNQRIQKIMDTATTNQGVVFPSNSFEKARLVWEVGTDTGTNGSHSTITDVSLDRLTVHMKKLPSSLRTPTFGVASLETGAPQYTPPTLVSLKETPEQIRKRQGAIWYAVVGMPCKVNHDPDPKEAHYLHVCFYWSDLYDRWLPLELSDDHPVKVLAKWPLEFPASYAFPVFF